jgi:hypothetical protein
MSKKAINRNIGFVLKTKKAEKAFSRYIIDKIVCFTGIKKADFKERELQGLIQGIDYKTMWT